MESWWDRTLSLKRTPYVILAVLLIAIQIHSPRFFCWDDNATFFSGAYQYNTQSLIHEKQFPWMIWAPYAGQTNLTQSQSGAFYPPAYLATLISWKIWENPFWNIDLLVGIHLFIGMAGIIQFLKYWKLPPSLCHAAALLYATTPFFLIVSRSWVFVSYAMAFTPWIFWGLHYFLEKKTFTSLIPYLLFKSFFFLQGYSHSCINLTLIEGLYFLFWWHRLSPSKQKFDSWKPIFQYSLAQIIYGILIFPQLWMNLIGVEQSAYRSQKISLSQILALHFDLSDGFLAQLFIFLPGRYFHSSSAILLCGGSLIFIYLLYYQLRTRSTLSTFSSRLQISLFFLILTFLLSTLFYAVLTPFPPFHILRWPFKFLMILPFFYSISFALICHETSALNPTSPWRIRLLAIAAFLQIGILFVPSALKPFSSLRYDSWSDFQISWNYQGGRVLPVGSSEKWMAHPSLLAYNYGTWTGIPTLGGYDPLISKTNAQIALGIQFSSHLEIQSIASNREHLNQWGVRYWTASPQDPQISILEREPRIQKIFQNSTLLVYENLDAFPLIRWESTPHEPVPFSWNARSLIIETGDKTGNLIVAFAPWSPSTNTNPQILSVPEQRSTFKISYPISPFYQYGLTLSIITWILLLGSYIVLLFKKEVKH